MIKVGQKAPDFTAPAYHKGQFTSVKLSDFLGKWVVLCFYPGDFTFVWATEVSAVAEKVAEFEIWAYEDYNDALKQFEFKDMKKGKEKINRNYDLKMLEYVDVVVDDYYYDCNNVYVKFLKLIERMQKITYKF